jgi:hypothetical protein
MFPNKERNWITGKYDFSINYDSWKQWIETDVYKLWQYSPLLWNIKQEDSIYTLQLVYSTKQGDMKILSVFIIVKDSDELSIQQWLKNQPWLSA